MNMNVFLVISQGLTSHDPVGIYAEYGKEIEVFVGAYGALGVF
jgi:hypothetical protein